MRMIRFGNSFRRRFLKSERGQAAVAVMITATTMMALSAASIETGHVYYAYQKLVASTNAAVMAGATAMPNTTTATTMVTQYSSQTGQLNANPMLTSDTATPTFKCLSTVSNSLNVPCQTAAGGSGGYNGLAVTQTATVPLWFGGLVGMSKMNMSYTAEAAMAGGTNTSWNIAIILDATPSMSFADNGDQCNGTQMTCAQQGIQALLNDLYPCQLSQTCNGSGAVAVDDVSLFVFPAVTAGTVYKDSTCNAGTPTAVAYTFPDPPGNTTLPSADTYKSVTWSIDYKTSDTATTLNTSSPLVVAAGGDASGSRCPGVTTRMEWTYYAQVIYAAQAELVAQQAKYPGSQNAIILLGDGDTEACASNANTTAGACNTSPISLVATEGTLNGTGTHTSNPSGYLSVDYPSALGQCGQSVLAAQTVANNGTAFYTIGYGAENTSAPRSQSNITGNCPSDIYYSASVTTNGGTWGKGGTPCQSLAAMASAATNFYSDDTNGCLATTPSNQNITKLTSIFRAITNRLSSPRLVPAGTT